MLDDVAMEMLSRPMTLLLGHEFFVLPQFDSATLPRTGNKVMCIQNIQLLQRLSSLWNLGYLAVTDDDLSIYEQLSSFGLAFTIGLMTSELSIELCRTQIQAADVVYAPSACSVLGVHSRLRPPATSAHLKHLLEHFSITPDPFTAASYYSVLSAYDATANRHVA